MAKKKQKPSAIDAGAHILLGTPGITMPADWYFGKVLWAHGDDLVIERQTATGKWLQIYHTAEVRAVGTIEELAEFKRLCVARVRKHQKRVRDLEQALGRARAAVWQELDEIAEEGLS